MKKYLITALFIIACFSRVVAQDEEGGRFEKIRAIRVTFITEHVHMTSEQAAKFWPVYDAFQNERRAVRRDNITKFLSTHPGATRDQARASLDGNLEFQSQELELKKKYKDRLLQIISQQQLDQLYQAERDFKISLLGRLKK